MVVLLVISAFIVWQPPSDGSPVDHYVFQILDENGDLFWSTLTQTTVVVVPGLDPERNYVGRVCAVDSQGRQGPWSAPFLWNNRPGAPSPPEMVLVSQEP